MGHLRTLKDLNSTFNANFYLVGGFVRDLLSDIKSEDLDIATDMHPEDLIRMAEEKNIKVFPTGLQHGTVTLIFDDQQLEITTFRKDFNNNGRHCSVDFTKSMKEDSCRRDFTINAIYLDEKGRYYDFHNGKSDLEKGRVKFIGNPDERIKEDYLRILRFFRFCSSFDKTAISTRDEDVKTALEFNASKLSELSADRISQEFLKMTESEKYIKGVI